MVKEFVTLDDISLHVDNLDQDRILRFCRVVLPLIKISFNNPTVIKDGIYCINSPMNRGVLFRCNVRSETDSFWIDFFYYIVHTITQQRYVLDHCYYQTVDQKITKHSAFIKPELILRTQIPVKQLFGNIFCVFKLNRGLPYEFKLLSNVYQGRNYQEALDFEYLIDLLFKANHK